MRGRARSGRRDAREEGAADVRSAGPGVLWVVGRDDAVDPLEIGAAPAPRPERRRKPPTVAILHRGADWIAVAKPAGVATTRERWFPTAPTVLSLLHAVLRRADPDAAVPLPVHRLDRETSGVVVFALAPSAAAALSRAFRRRAVLKEYLALVVGAPPTPSGSASPRLSRERREGGLVRVVRHGGRPSHTEWTTEEAFSGWTLLRVVPRTGRTHQVRATLADLGCPIAGDSLYGGGDGVFLSALKPGYRPPADHPERPLLGRVGLHALRVAVAAAAPEGGDPAVAAAVDVTCPLPRDLRVTLENLRRYRPAPIPPS